MHPYTNMLNQRLQLQGLQGNISLVGGHLRCGGSQSTQQIGPLLPTASPANKQSRRSLRSHSRITVVAQAVASNSTSGSISIESKDPILLWFKHDLRTDDHVGLIESVKSGAPIIPVFCYDPACYSYLIHSPASANALYRAVGSLKAALQALGSDLLITTGSFDTVLPALAEQTGAKTIVTEREVETIWNLHGIQAVSKAVSNNLIIKTWSTPLLTDYPSDDYKELKAALPTVNNPLDAPTSIPSNHILMDNASILKEQLQQQLPSPHELLLMARQHVASTAHPAIRTALFNDGLAKRASDNPLLSSTDDDSQPTASTVIDSVATSLVGNSSSNNNNNTQEAAWPGDGFPEQLIEESTGASSWDNELATELATGEGPVLDALRGYLTFIETTASGGGSNLHWKLGSAIAKYDVPATPEGCFPALFGRSLSLGVVSRRRIYAEAKRLLNTVGQEEEASPVGLLAKMGWLLTSSGGAVARRNRQRKAKAAALAAEAGDFHEAMAADREGSVIHHGCVLRHYRWRGILTDYIEAVPAPGTEIPNAPVIMLVHGFGAFGEHYRDNVAALAAQGFHVVAPTFPGYGRAEKPAVAYGQDLWRDFLGDFVDTVIKKPVVIAGNSIGGFISASMAADFPGRVQGLVLVNSAGLLQAGYTLPTKPQPNPNPPSFVVEGVSRALFTFLEGDVERQLKRVYPVVPNRADSWLAKEIIRSARDPGALGVFRSVFYLKKPRALNWLVSTAYGGPTLVLQGAKDPLNDAVGRAKKLDELCPNIEVELLDAGHCPHDEVPELVNKKLKEFVVNKVMVGAGGGQKQQISVV